MILSVDSDALTLQLDDEETRLSIKRHYRKRTVPNSAVGS